MHIYFHNRRDPKFTWLSKARERGSKPTTGESMSRIDMLKVTQKAECILSDIYAKFESITPGRVLQVVPEVGGHLEHLLWFLVNMHMLNLIYAQLEGCPFFFIIWKLLMKVWVSCFLITLYQTRYKFWHVLEVSEMLWGFNAFILTQGTGTQESPVTCAVR